jgi:hypothetical protein
VCNFLAPFLLPIFGYVSESIFILHSRSC